MNAPFGWPTNVPLPKFRVRHIAAGSLGFLVVSCSENLTAPGKPPVFPDPGAAAAAADIIVVERTTTSAAEQGQTPIVHTSRQVLTPHVRIAARSSLVRTSTSPTTTAPQVLPLPPVSLPARREVAICNALPSWTERTRDANGRDIVLTGVADAPASSIKITQDDGSVWTVERSWTRTVTSWQLDRQVTSGARGYRDVVTYQHQSATGKAVNNALPVSACTGQQPLVGPATVAASRTFYPAYSGALYSKLVPASGVSADDGCWNNSGDPCYDKRMAVYKSDVALLAAAGAMTLACVTPVSVAVIPCVAATTLYFAAIANLAIDQASLENCLQDAGKPKGTELSVGSSGASTFATIANAARSMSPIGATTLNSCGTDAGTGSPSAAHCRWDVYEISYDGGKTWNAFAQFMVCDNAS